MTNAENAPRRIGDAIAEGLPDLEAEVVWLCFGPDDGSAPTVEKLTTTLTLGRRRVPRIETGVLDKLETSLPQSSL